MKYIPSLPYFIRDWIRKDDRSINRRQESRAYPCSVSVLPRLQASPLTSRREGTLIDCRPKIVRS
ncbi:hypothetical protein WN55_07483 [Dufourea novaeangliae]|uniref:Uncharacterized protein n=1 Tax=Dufourea novaeangliae TaxID=178035 RepID=A0A154PTH5_DUFNO|nr:hypothetical protein WN55_07483 [Dufourea novaeangliae]